MFPIPSFPVLNKDLQLPRTASEAKRVAAEQNRRAREEAATKNRARDAQVRQIARDVNRYGPHATTAAPKQRPSQPARVPSPLTSALDRASGASASRKSPTFSTADVYRERNAPRRQDVTPGAAFSTRDVYATRNRQGDAA